MVEGKYLTTGLNEIHSISPNSSYYEDALAFGKDYVTSNGILIR